MKNPVFWLFCTVIDNFGDIGVAWRLAQQLQARLNAKVYLWLDDFTALQTIVPDWQHSFIRVSAWQEGQDIDLHQIEAADVVIETFACRLPENVLAAIQQSGAVWLNWEYLSAEDWAVRTHAMQSIQSNGVNKYFWQMGFLSQTGGLLREADYLEKQQQFFRQPENSIKPTHSSSENPPVRLFIFAYDSTVWAKWARAWQSLAYPIELHIAAHQVWQALQRDGFLPQNPSNNNKTWISGSLKLEKAAFVPQQNFDTHLWAADMLIIRGEDSFVRAQWAGKPFLWHIYPQEEAAHLDKLAAFWRLPQTHCPQPDIQAAFHALSADLNGETVLTESECAAYWQVLFAHRSAWQTQARAWQQFLLAQTDAVTRLAEFLQNQLPPRSQ